MNDKWVEEQEEKRYSKLQWFFVVIVIPTIFAVAVALVVATVAGVNVVEKAKVVSDKIPFLSSSEQEKKQKSEEMENKLTELTAEVKDREETIKDLQAKNEGKDQKIEKLQLETERLQREIEDLTVKQQENSLGFKGVVKTYETMSAKKAAPIITSMNDDEALNILSNLKSDTLAAIMEQMNAADAAKFTSLLTNDSEINTDQ